MKEKMNPPVEVKEREVTISHVIDAPREIVYRALSIADDLEQWWGPKDFTNEIEIDFRPGGNYSIVMQDPKGVAYPMKGIYKEIIENEKIVMTTDLDDHPLEWRDKLYKSLPQKDRDTALVSTMTFQLHDKGDKKTLLSVTGRFESNAIRDAYKNMGMVDGWTESFERLQNVVARQKVD